MLGVADGREGEAAVRFAFREAAAREAALLAVRAWRCPLTEGGLSSMPDQEATRRYETTAADHIEKSLHDAAADHPSVEAHRQAGEGPARNVLLNASSTADLLVVGALRRAGHFGLQLGPVAHTLLHHALCPVAVVPQRA
ncbi:universal stress protein [Streptomyces brevispora]|uniref:Nucleotide-binding universal stress UspA family protein n=1 Tax=Streptomyces brevispora TaxID=887462 RepID=A0A561UR07_9ACTN|nr:universal stress protein [Streptomyces brevispora]TWG01807.1 nucleotide-binding universal stress UspA family protein [Streptomyces brevispora]